MTRRTATCSCGRIRLTSEGEPIRISICHCLACQKRTGSIFATQARFTRDQVTIEGLSFTWTRRGDSGGSATFHFCPSCGATVWWTFDGVADFIMITVGAFADPDFPPPRISVYDERRHPWAFAVGDLPMEHMD